MLSRDQKNWVISLQFTTMQWTDSVGPSLSHLSIFPSLPLDSYYKSKMASSQGRHAKMKIIIDCRYWRCPSYHDSAFSWSGCLSYHLYLWKCGRRPSFQECTQDTWSLRANRHTSVQGSTSGHARYGIKLKDSFTEDISSTLSFRMVVKFILKSTFACVRVPGGGGGRYEFRSMVRSLPPGVPPYMDYMGGFLKIESLNWVSFLPLLALCSRCDP